MKDIIISPTKKISSDSKHINWVYSEKVKNKKTGERYWKPKWYYPSLTVCYLDLLDYFTLASDKETLDDAFGEAVDKLEVIKREIKKYGKSS